MLENYTLVTAKVITINDPQKKRRVQIQPLPELKDVVNNSDLPWAIPFSTYGSASIMENNLPELNSLIRVLVRKDWKRFYYLNNRFFYNIFNYTTIQNKLNSVTELTNKDYQNMQFRLYKDGGLEFHNTQNGDHGYLHKSGSYTLFDNGGNIITNANGKNLSVDNANTISFTSTGNTEITSNAGVFVTGAVVEIEGTTSATIDSPSVTITGGTLNTNGVVVPTGSGPYCGLPFCPILGIPQSGNVVTGT